MLNLIPVAFVQSLVRHALTAGGTWLIAKGIGDAALVEGIIGVGVTGAGLLWSWLTHKAPPPA